MKRKLNNIVDHLIFLLKKLARYFKRCFYKFKGNRMAKISTMIVFLLIIVIILILFKERIKTDYFYQSILGKSFEYQAQYNLKGNKVNNFKIKNYKIDYKVSPIYFKNSDRIFFGSNYSIMFMKNYTQYQLGDNLIITKNRKNYLIGKKEYNNFILFNGKNLFFFSSDSILYYNGISVKLHGGSYCILWNNQQLEYYDSNNNQSVLVDLNGKAYVMMDNKKIDLGLKSVLENDHEYLFQTKLKYLKLLEDYEKNNKNK